MEKSFKRIDTDFCAKLKYLGYCTKCKKETPHRFAGGTLYVNRYRCMKCKTINEEVG